MSAAPPLNASTPTLIRQAIAVTVGLFVLHIIVASRLELMFDEAYYRLWADYPAAGYHDHPPMVALWIWVSAKLFGTSELGIRALGIFATALGSLGLYAIGLDVFSSKAKAALAVVLWNAMPLIGVGAILVTPDAPLVFGWTTALWGLGRLYQTGDWRWWLVVGAATGIALEAKYSALFIGPGLALAMIVVPRLRRWWTHPAPYAGGALAFALFAPNVLWNVGHQWQTFTKQFGRVADAEWTLRFVVEFLGSQIGLMGPLTFILAVAGAVQAWRGGDDDAIGGRRLLAALAAPFLLFLTLHSLHDRVQGNWAACLYPIAALLAADAALTSFAHPAWATRPLALARGWAVPSGLGLTALIYAQALFGLFPVPPRADPTALLTGWRQLARDLDGIAEREGATYVLTQGYALTSLLKVYAPGARPVEQFNERQRWTYRPAPNLDRLKPGLFVVELKRAGAEALGRRFSAITELARLDRRGPRGVVETYAVYRLSAPRSEILDKPQLTR